MTRRSRTTRGIALAVLAAAAPLAVAALAVPDLFPGASAAWLLAALTAVVPVALMAIGAPGPAGPPGRARRAVFLALAVLLAATALGVLALSGLPAGADPDGAGGLPLAMVVQLVGLWLLPLPLATLGYALTFDRTGLRRDELDALRRRVSPRGD